ncbi:gliding motility-associated ABC transporter substrate-binding protein GldG [Cytophagaceae bacterium ABcell3]|nr:gliding motility-associated ABC transporter substrate-binding protein GldG [Cytophagaceae bacterium ABcell3]
MVKNKWNQIIEYVLILIIIVLVNIIASGHFFRIDLTEDKRYTISDTSIDILKELDDVVTVEVYLEGEFPSGFERLQRTIRETLDEFRIHAGTKIQYRFINPGAEADEEMRKRIYYQLAQKGIQPTNLFAKEGDKKVEKLIFPGAMLSYKNQEVPVMLLKGNKTADPQETLNQSVEGVEYELISAIRQLTQKKRKSIAFIEGHGELNEVEVADLKSSLQKYYNVYRINLEDTRELDNYDALVVAAPKTPYTEQEKFLIDQYIVNGGKAMFFINNVNVDMDSLGDEGGVIFPYETNLDDLLFRYGVRLNYNLIKDLNSGYIPVNVGMMGDKPNVQMVNWRFFPLLNTFGNHPIVKNMDAVYGKFVGSMDSVKADGIVKTPLVFSSKYSKLLNAPAKLSLNEMRADANPREYNKGPQAMMFLLEGKFTSLYKNRPSPVAGQKAVGQNQSSSILVCSDGDFIRNEMDPKRNEVLPLGYDMYSRQTFGNKELVLNAVAHLLDDKGIVNVRAREVILRPLDKVRIEEERLMWQIINLAVPVILIIGFGVVRYIYRKRKFEQFRS